MINNQKAIIFDLDGVLINSRDMHWEALNKALEIINPKFMIDYPEHLAKYDGLSTTRKLEMLSDEKGLPESVFTDVWKLKQEFTKQAYEQISESPKLQELFRSLRDRGFKLGVATNSIRETMLIALDNLGLLQDGMLGMIDVTLSNEDVERHKPYPDIYWLGMQCLNTLPGNTWIVEDSHIGREAALTSGAHLIPIERLEDVNFEYMEKALESYGNRYKSKIPFKNSKMNVLIPMAGLGSRFEKAGYTFPKPLIDIDGKPMIQKVVENLNVEAKFIFVVQEEHYQKYQLKYLLNLIAPSCEIVRICGLTEGAACTALKARHLIENDSPLLIANSDQILDWNSNEALYAFSNPEIDGGILTFEGTHPKWSFIKTDEHGFISEVQEKKVISNQATCGVYYWKRGIDFVWSAVEMMEDSSATVNGEWYIAPTFNYNINRGKKYRPYQIKRMWGVGTPEDLNYYLQNYKQGKE